jgi:hypothetical protein
MAKNKTVETKASVAQYLKKIADESKRNDCTLIVDLISKNTGLEAKMWGTAIVGWGSYHYHYDSGREGDAPLVGFAARANAIVFYLGSNFDKREELLAKFGKHTIGGGCVYIKKLEDIDTGILIKMVKKTIDHNKKEHDC